MAAYLRQGDSHLPQQRFLQMLREFWATHAQRGIHPRDVHAIPEPRILDWTAEIAAAHASVFAPGQPRHPLFFRIHQNLFPLPFVGDLDNSDVVILLGNPGFGVGDYTDESVNANHQAALMGNFQNGEAGFFPLTPASTNTGAGNYWETCLDDVILGLAASLNDNEAIARSEVIRRVSVVESLAYHSKKMPNLKLEDIPSSVEARSYVQNLLPRAAAGKKLIFVWRSKDFWKIPETSPGVIFRPKKQAQGPIRATESAQIVRFLAERYRH
jgi:hypothetical protein